MAALRIREQHKDLAIKILLAVGLCTAFFYALIRPVFSESILLRQQIQDSQAKIKLSKDVQQLKDELQVAEQPFAAMSMRSSLVGRISDIANKKKLDVQTLTPKTTPEGEYVVIKVEISAQAPFFSLLNFLKDMETLEPPFSVSSLSLVQLPYVRTRENPSGKQQIRLSMETLLLKQARKGKKI